MTTMKMRTVVVAVLAVGVLASCGRSRVVRPPSEGSAAKQTGTVSPARVSSPKYGATAVVQRGQTVYRIATENGITPLDLALWNNIQPPYTIYPGQRLRL
jgi:lipoprotein NlpD